MAISQSELHFKSTWNCSIDFTIYTGTRKKPLQIRNCLQPMTCVSPLCYCIFDKYCKQTAMLLMKDENLRKFQRLLFSKCYVGSFITIISRQTWFLYKHPCTITSADVYSPMDFEYSVKARWVTSYMKKEQMCCQ